MRKAPTGGTFRGVKHGRRARSLVLAAALGLGGALASLSPQLLALDESLGLGALFAIRGPLPAPGAVAIVSISRDAAAAVGQTNELDTWPRDLHARLVERLTAAGASSIAFDLIFNEAREPAADGAFGDSIARAGSVILAERLETRPVTLRADVKGELERRVLPLPELKAAALASAPFVLPTVPVRVGQFWTFGRATSDTPSLPVVAVQAHLLPYYEDLLRLLERAAPGVTASLPQTRAAVEATHALEGTMRSIRGAFEGDAALGTAVRAQLDALPLSADGAAALRVLVDLYAGPSSRFLNFYGPARAIRTLPYDQVLSGSEMPRLAGVTVFVGLAEPYQPEQLDDFYSVFSEQSGDNLSGVEVGATAFANLLERRSLTPLALPLHWLLVLALGAGFGAFMPSLSTRRAAAVASTGAATYFAIAYWQFASAAVWLPLVVPLLLQLPLAFGAVVWQNYRELAVQRERVHTALGYYVPRALARRLAEQTVATSAERQLLHGTCLYTDAEHYTTVSEALRPEDLVVFMNDYYRTMFTVVEQYGGEISDTAGDSMVAVWATADPDPAARRRASEAAVALLAAVDAFNDAQRGWRLPTRVGLESGELLLGNVGAEQRYEYRAIGDIVNTAARIQGLNSLLGTRVLVSSATLAGTGLRAREIGTFVLRGKRLPVTVHELLRAAPRSLDEDLLAAFGVALAAFRAAQWSDAELRFAALLAGGTDDGPSRYYHDLAGRYRLAPPAGWAGAVHVTAK